MWLPYIIDLCVATLCDARTISRSSPVQKNMKRKVVLPDTIWSMKKLRHVHVSNHAIFTLPIDKKDRSLQLDSLVTLSLPYFLMVLSISSFPENWFEYLSFNLSVVSYLSSVCRGVSILLYTLICISGRVRRW